MARFARRHSASGFYHIMIRGVDKMDIFQDNSDRFWFLNKMKEAAKASDTQVVAWCLMSNHVHILAYLKDSAIPAKFMHMLNGCYAMHFNRKYKRVGHLFQNRYLSEVVEDISYLLTVFKYILHNPQKAGVCASGSYYWSSFHEYISDSIYTNTQILANYLKSNGGFMKIMGAAASIKDEYYKLRAEREKARREYSKLLRDAADRSLHIDLTGSRLAEQLLNYHEENDSDPEDL